MSQVRKDAFTDNIVIFATERLGKPYEFKIEKSSYAGSSENCPFCHGNEFMTPEEISDVKNEDGSWRMRLIPNKFPALSLNNSINGDSKEIIYELDDNNIKENDSNNQSEISPHYTIKPGIGVHELLIDTAQHDSQPHLYSREQFIEIITFLQNRISVLKKNDDLSYIQIFKNVGFRAGASIWHSHWQIVGSTFVPPSQRSIMSNSNKHFDITGKCLFCDILQFEIKNKTRIIYDSEHFVVFAPFASRFMYETWVAPKFHLNSLTDLKEDDISSLSDIILNILNSINTSLKGSSYNICFMDSIKEDINKRSHWHIQIIPRIGGFAGYEYSTGTYINPILPENAANILRRRMSSF